MPTAKRRLSEIAPTPARARETISAASASPAFLQDAEEFL